MDNEIMIPERRKGENEISAFPLPNDAALIQSTLEAGALLADTNDLPVERNRRLLVIDDNRAIHDDFRKIFSPDSIAAAALDKTETALFAKPRNVLRQIQYEIDSAYQGQEGVRLVKQALDKERPYAMAFVDVRMPPGWDGVETTRRILEIDPDIQIVICTAYADYSWEEMFKKIGNRDGLLILKKPFDTVEAFQLAHASRRNGGCTNSPGKKWKSWSAGSPSASASCSRATTRSRRKLSNTRGRKKSCEARRRSLRPR